MVNKDQSSGTGKEETTSPVTPSKTSDSRGEEQTHDEDQTEVVSVLPSNDRIPRQVRNIGRSNSRSRLEDHPSDVGPPESLVRRIRVKLGVSVSVVSTVTSGPPLDGPLDSTSASGRETVLERGRSVVRSVRPQSVVARGDTETGNEVVDDGPDRCFPAEVGREGTVDGQRRCDGQNKSRDPADVLEQVLGRDRRQVFLVLQGLRDVVIGEKCVGRNVSRCDGLDR